MSKWVDQYKQHAFFSTWDKLKVSADDPNLEDIIDESSLPELARMRKVLSHIDHMLEHVDPEIFPFNQINNLNNQANNCLTQLNSFKGNRNFGHLTNVNNGLDQMILVLHQIVGPLQISSSNAIISYSETIDRYIRKYRDEIDAGISKLTTEVESLQTEVNSLSVDLSKLDDGIRTATQTIQQQIAEFNTQYQESEKGRQLKFDSVLEKYIDKADAEFESLSIKSAKIIEVLVKLQDDASKVYNVTINTLQGGAYSSYANDEGKQANRLRWAAVFFMLVSVGFLVWPEAKALLTPGNYAFEWEKVLGRAPLSAIMFIPAFYFARESAKHRNIEVSNRRRQHILSTLDPYIELMDSAKAEEIKLHVAKSIFSELKTDSFDSDKEASNIISQIANLAKQFKK